MKPPEVPAKLALCSGGWRMALLGHRAGGSPFSLNVRQGCDRRIHGSPQSFRLLLRGRSSCLPSA